MSTTATHPPTPIDAQALLEGVDADAGAWVLVPLGDLLSALTIAQTQTRDRNGHVQPGKAAMYLARTLRSQGHLHNPNHERPPEVSR